MNTIESISGNFLTFVDAWVTTLGSNVDLYFADYIDSNADQQAQFAYTCNDTNVFTGATSAGGGLPAYKIILG